VSEASLQEAAENERNNGGEEMYAVREGIASQKGEVTWMKADFFDVENPLLKPGSFDLIYDYTVSSPCLFIGELYLRLSGRLA
jgi:hypothetical protein